ncbi:MAG: AAA family ATPase [Gammaproteobacteria bacterium]|nr:AAA family ATPase [Gammaproteobacteria bacterium]
MTWLVSRDSLTPDQTRVVEFDTRTHHLVLGSPGSGKTIVALHRARELVDRLGTAPSRFSLLVYTKALKAYIKSGLDDLDLSHDSVLTFDQWCRKYYRAQIGKSVPKDEEGKPSFQQIRWEIYKYVSKRKPRLLDFVIVDEGQDLDWIAFEILTAISGHVTVFMDSKQQIFENGSSQNDVLKALCIDRRDLELLGAYRCTPYIVSVAASFIPDEIERKRFTDQTRDKGPKQKPLVYIAGDHDALFNHLVDVLRTRVDRGERIGILLPSNKLVHSIGKKLREVGFDIEFPITIGRKNNSEKPGHNFASVRPKLMAYPSAKGLTFDTVLLPFFNRREFREDFSEALLERWIFVAMSRATQWIYINGSSEQHEELFYEKRFQSLENQFQLTIQRDFENESKQTSKQSDHEDNADAEEEDLSDMF